MFRPGLALLLAWLAFPAGAEIYKWTDAQGKVHYGDQPPASVVPTPITPQAGGEARAQEARRQAAEAAIRKRMEQEKDREEALKRQTADAEQSRRKAENCQRARGNLELLQRMHTRLTTVDSQGQAQVLDAAARQTEMERAIQSIAENCR